MTSPESVYFVSMPHLAPELHPRCEEAVKVALLSEVRNLWMRLDSVPWLLQFLRDQYTQGGVQAPAVRDDAPLASEGVTRDFRDQAWQGVAKDIADIDAGRRTRTTAIRRTTDGLTKVVGWCVLVLPPMLKTPAATGPLARHLPRPLRQAPPTV